MASDGKLRVGIVGASGFTGAELMRLIAAHPHMSSLPQAATPKLEAKYVPYTQASPPILGT